MSLWQTLAWIAILAGALFLALRRQRRRIARAVGSTVILKAFGLGPAAAYAALGATLVAVSFLGARFGSMWTVLALLPLAVWCAVDLLWLRRRRRARFFRDIEAQDYRVCSGCAYSLRGHADFGVCPECGRTYERTSLVKTWTRLRGH
jgi:uncharacterized paraquat-inducible protein A